MQGKLMGKDWNRHFTKEDIWMANGHRNNVQYSLIIRKQTTIKVIDTTLIRLIGGEVPVSV